MFGPPKDVIGECNARLYLGDDYGDNVCTFRCQLHPGHSGPHQEAPERGGGKVSVTWDVDERGLEDEDGLEDEEDLDAP